MLIIYLSHANADYENPVLRFCGCHVRFSPQMQVVTQVRTDRTVPDKKRSVTVRDYRLTPGTAKIVFERAQEDVSLGLEYTCCSSCNSVIKKKIYIYIRL